MASESGGAPGASPRARRILRGGTSARREAVERIVGIGGQRERLGLAGTGNRDVEVAQRVQARCAAAQRGQHTRACRRRGHASGVPGSTAIGIANGAVSWFSTEASAATGSASAKVLPAPGLLSFSQTSPPIARKI